MKRNVQKKTSWKRPHKYKEGKTTELSWWCIFPGYFRYLPFTSQLLGLVQTMNLLKEHQDRFMQNDRCMCCTLSSRVMGWFSILNTNIIFHRFRVIASDDSLLVCVWTCKPQICNHRPGNETDTFLLHKISFCFKVYGSYWSHLNFTENIYLWKGSTFSYSTIQIQSLI